MSIVIPQDTRCELKGIAKGTYYPNLLIWLRTHPEGFSMPYPSRTINSVYFDNYELSAYEENLLGASSRVKVRYRWYGESRTPDAGRLEIKCKKNSYGWKLNYPVQSAPYHPGTTWHMIMDILQCHLPFEGKRWLYEYPWPVLIIRYHRDYFISKDQRIRITIDSRQSAFDQRYKSLPNLERPSNFPNTVVMEIKCEKEIRETMIQRMGNVPLRISRNSKYMIGMKSIQGY